MACVIFLTLQTKVRIYRPISNSLFYQGDIVKQYKLVACIANNRLKKGLSSWIDSNWIDSK